MARKILLKAGVTITDQTASREERGRRYNRRTDSRR